MLSRHHVKRFETFAVAVAVLGAVFKTLQWKGADFILIAGLGALSVCHLLFGFLHEATDRKGIITNYLRHFGLAILIMGGLFYLMRWNDPTFMFAIGGFGLLASFVVERQ